MVQNLKIGAVVGAIVLSLPAVASAQGVTTQQGIVGQSGQQVFSQQVRGADGNLYNCRPNVENVNGVPTRFCRRVSGGTITTGGGVSGNAALFGLVGLGVVAALIGGDDSSSGTD